MASNTSSAASTLRKSKKDDVEALLSDLDNLDQSSSGEKGSTATAGKGAAASSATKADDAQSLLDDLDDLVKRRAPTPKKSTLLSRTTSGTSSFKGSKANSGTATPIPSNTLAADGGLTTTMAAGSSQPLEETDLHEVNTASKEEQAGGGSGGGLMNASASSSAQPSWGTWWNSATKLADQARMELEKRAAQVQSQVAETAREASEGRGVAGSSTAKVPWTIAQNVNSFLQNNKDLNKLRADLGKVGIKGWNELMNVVVPPIEKHEVLSITLSHDMVGFDGINDVVFAVLQKVMESHATSQGSEQQLVVNKAPERKSISEERASSDASDEDRNMKAVTGFEQGWKLAETKLSELISSESKAKETQTPAASNGITLPITTCPIYLRVQPVLASLPGDTTASPPHPNPTHLFLEILLRDPTNALTHKTISQPIPKAFIDLDFEEHSWVEELLSESLQTALGSIALEYIQGRNLGTSLRADVVEAAATAAAAEKEGSNSVYESKA